ncbi:MAG TPA: class I SAM-dependent methyltransferase [Kofleriaceae bacterium]|nr:class I SAM-dependent methyltransferase [Kofleriaceae bacterium]
MSRRLLVVALAASALAVGWYGRGALAPPPGDFDAESLARTTREAFEQIYQEKRWGTSGTGDGTSGAGSTLGATMWWRLYLQRFMAIYDVHSVVDAGCGDWEFSRAIDWSGIDYKGFDIVDAVIAEDRRRFEAPNIHFFTANIVDTDLPPADLLIVKHVLQHLPNADVAKFISQLSKYKHVLIVDGVDRQTLSALNTDTVPGGYRQLDLTAPPFNLHGTKVLTYLGDDQAMHQVVHIIHGGR